LGEAGERRATRGTARRATRMRLVGRVALGGSARKVRCRGAIECHGPREECAWHRRCATKLGAQQRRQQRARILSRRLRAARRARGSGVQRP